MPGLHFGTSPDLELVKTALDKIRAGEEQDYNKVGKALATDPLIFTQESADRAAVVTGVLGGGGYFQKTITGTAQDVTSKKNSNKNMVAPRTTEIAEFNKDVPISRSFMQDQQHSAVAKTIRQETLAWFSSRDQNAFAFYAYGFGTTRSSTIDGVALFSNSHVSANGDTVDNLETGALSDANLNTAVVSLRGQVNQTGVRVGYDPDFLLVGSSLHHDAMIVAKSVLKAGGAQNDLNYYSELFPGMQVKWNQHIDNSGASNQTTLYVLGARDHGVVRFEREAFFSELVDWRTDPDDLYKYKLRAREEVDTIEYSGLVGSNGSV